jgi:Nuclease-related domain
VVAVRVRASVGRPGASAQGEYRRRRATERAAWIRGLPWRAAAVLAAGLTAGLLAMQLAPHLTPLAAVLAVAGVGWQLRFRPSPETRAWRRGAAGERRTARLLASLERCGWAVLHDLAVPGSAANIDHLVIGPGGVLVIDSKPYRAGCGSTPTGCSGTAATCSSRPCARPAGRPTRPTKSSASRRSRFPRLSPSMGPAFPGAESRPTGSQSSRPGGCPTCCRRYRRSLGPSGSRGWPTEPGCGSAPPPDRPHQQALDVPLLAQPDLDGRLVRLTAFDRGAPAHCCP